MDVCISPLGVKYEMDEEIILATQADLDRAICLISWHFYQAKQRGDDPVVELWSPKIPNRKAVKDGRT